MKLTLFTEVTAFTVPVVAVFTFLDFVNTELMYSVYPL